MFFGLLLSLLNIKLEINWAKKYWSRKGLEINGVRNI
jgi:hypothetical protein